MHYLSALCRETDYSPCVKRFTAQESIAKHCTTGSTITGKSCSIFKRSIELNNKIVAEIIGYATTVTRCITDYPVRFGDYLYI